MSLLLLASAALLAAGCVTSTPQSRISRNRATYDRLPSAVQLKVIAGEVDVGFTEEMVLLALGEPGRKFHRTDEKGEAEVWVYYRRQPHVSLGFGVNSGGYGGVATGVSMSTATDPDDEVLRVSFQEGKVAVIEKTQR